VRVLFAHNRYQQSGGEDRVVSEESRMLEKRGHTVSLFLLDNDAIVGSLDSLRAGLESFYSRRTAHRLDAVLKSFRPDVIHVHNFQPTLSPAVFFCAKRAGVPVVHTLHNYRLICASAGLFRSGEICQDCVKARSFLPGIMHSCYRNSRLGSAAVGANMAFHSAIGTWTRRVDRYIALTESSRALLTQFRIPPELVRIKPNFVEDVAVGNGSGDFALFTGRLTEEKGINTLMEADRRFSLAMPIYVAGNGPLMSQIQQAAERPGSKLRILGWQERVEVQRLMREAKVMLVPSIWHEPMPMAIVESLATGLPVIATRMGGLPEIIDDGVTGKLIPPSDAEALAKAIEELATSHENLQAMRLAARSSYERRFSEDENYRILMNIYGEISSKANA
jgi:glycosyltransferase involved in cell wall biosynthesis